MLGNILTRKKILKAGYGNKEGKRVLKAGYGGYGNKKVSMPRHTLTKFEIQTCYQNGLRF